MPLDTKLVGKRITEAREERGQSLSALAEVAGIAKSYLLKLERGEVDNPGLATLYSVARGLELTLASLLQKGTASPAPPSDWETIEPGIPQSLRDFLRKNEKEGSRITTDMKVSLARIQFRGKHPDSTSDWDFVYQAIQRSIR